MAEAVDNHANREDDGFEIDKHHCPPFRSYEKMEERSHKYIGDLQHIKKWVVLEKIHGSNFSLTVWPKSSKEGDIGVKLGRRNAYLRAEEKFFEIETHLEFQANLKACAIKAWSVLQETGGIGQVKGMTIFGELFGGFYPHSSVDSVSGVAVIQREVVYCPEVKFCGFDIALYRSGQEREYMDYDKVMMILSEAGFMYCKPLCVCTFEEAVNYPLGFVTTLPSLLGLPPIKDNLAEGVVIKPMQTIEMATKKGQQRVIFKRKIDKFSERKPIVPRAKNPKEKSYPMTDKAELLKYEMYALITEQRLVNAISKIGLPSESDEPKWLEIKENIVKDVTETLEDENEELWEEACTPAAKELLMKEVDQLCSELIEEYRQKQ